MKPAPFDYIAPKTIEAACKALTEAAGGATILAGGQTLVPLLNLRMSQPFIVIDVNQITELKGVSAVSAGGIRIGANTRQCEMLGHELLARDLPVLVEAVRHVGHYQTRNRGTLGGSIALGEPAAELPATAVALGATIEVRSTRGTRSIAAADFYVAPYVTALAPDELVTSIYFPEWPRGHIKLFREVARRPGDFALVGVVGALHVQGGVIRRVGLAWFGMGPTPMRAAQAEAALINLPAVEVRPSFIAELAISDTNPFDDHHAPAEYRRTVGQRILENMLRSALDLKDAA